MKEGIMEAVVAEEADFKILKIVKHPSKPVGLGGRVQGLERRQGMRLNPI
jgi:hypothetical protein